MLKITVSFAIEKHGRPFINGENDLSAFEHERMVSELASFGAEVAKFVALARLESHGSLSDDAGPVDYDGPDAP